MKKINIGKATVSLIEDDIVLFEANADIVIDKETSLNFYRGIEDNVSGDYSLIIHRKHKYQLLRMEVFSVINSRERLRTMAIVAPKAAAKKMADLEAPLCQKPFATFLTIDDAVAWVKEQPRD